MDGRTGSKLRRAARTPGRVMWLVPSLDWFPPAFPLPLVPMAPSGLYVGHVGERDLDHFSLGFCSLQIRVQLLYFLLSLGYLGFTLE